MRLELTRGGRGVQIALTHFSDLFQRRLAPLKRAPPRQIASTCPRAKGAFGSPRGAGGSLPEGPPPSTRIWKGGAGEREIKAKDYLCFSCTGVRFFTRFDANVSFSMLHVSFFVLICFLLNKREKCVYFWQFKVM